MNEIIWLGIAGKKRHGKDSFAQDVSRHLCDRGHRVCIRALADALKVEVAEFVGTQLTGSPDPRVHRFPSRNVATVQDWLYSDQPEEKEPFRLLLQWWGTEFRRAWFGPDYWTKKLAEWAETRRAALPAAIPLVVIVPDVRFPDEATFIRERGGLLVRIVRFLDDSDQHPSETALDDYLGWTATIFNNHDRSELSRQAGRFVEDHLEPRLS